MVSGFLPQTPSPHSRLRTQCPQSPPLRVRCTTITLHYPPSPFAMADPESSHYGLVSGFRPSTPSPRLRLRTQRPWPLPLWEQHTTTTLHHSPTLFDAAGPEPSHSGLVLRCKLREKATTGGRRCDTHGPAWASTGATQTERRGRARTGSSSSAAITTTAGPTLPHFFVSFFYLANMSRLVVVPSPDLLTYFNVIKCNSNNFL